MQKDQDDEPDHGSDRTDGHKEDLRPSQVSRGSTASIWTSQCGRVAAVDGVEGSIARQPPQHDPAAMLSSPAMIGTATFAEKQNVNSRRYQ